MNVVFMGTPDFAVPAFMAIQECNHKIIAVVTPPDKKAGRGLQLKMSAVKSCAIQYNIPIFQPEHLDDQLFLKEIKQLNPDVGVVIAFKKLPSSLWQIPKSGTFNLHASLLPQYRGAAPIHRVVMNGETETGLTTFFLNEGIDTGQIIQSQAIPIGEQDTYDSLHNTLSIKGAQLVVTTLDLIEQKAVIPISQDEIIQKHNIFELKKAPKIFSEDRLIDWRKTSFQIRNQIRGLSSTPGAYSVMAHSTGKTNSLKIFDGETTTQYNNLQPGEIMFLKHQMCVGTGDHQSILINDIQPESKSRMMVEHFKNGLKELSGWKFIQRQQE